MSFARLVTLAAGLLVAAGRAAAADPGAELFEAKIRPVLVEHCYSCHSAAAGKAKGGFTLDTRGGLRTGGDGGPAVVPGKPAGGLLLKALRYTDESLRMPPKGKLPDAVVADFETWIKLGAVDPRTDAAKPDTVAGNWDATFRERQKHWSLQPVRPVAPPAVGDPAWEANGVDRFVRAKLIEQNLAPAPEADRRTLLRRVTYALTGLPPTAGEIDAFLADPSPTAYETVVDRLLASPRFGERFATHWLDVIRYADTHGSEGDPPVPFAWRYRDSVVRAFNADVPYDRFVREQVAGDLLPPRPGPDGANEAALGPAHFRMVEHGYQPVDSLDERAKTLENQIDVLGKAVLGLTVACARCHDHKFDAIGQRDYTALYGVLSSTRPGQVTVDDPARLRRHADELAAIKARIKAALVEAWLRDADALPRRLLAHDRTPPAPNDGRVALERRLADLDRLGSEAVRLARGKPAAAAGPRPVAAWRFDGDALDSVGSAHAELIGGAVVRDGRLVLDGTGAFARSAPLPFPTREKTLEAWVVLAAVGQKGAGVVTLQSKGGEVFDAIVFGEQRAGRWVAGSDNFRRTRDLDGPAETTAGRPVHLAATYAADGTVALFRDGEPYGTPYKADDGPVLFVPDESRVLIGMRHATRGPLAGEVDEVRLYDRALSADEIRASFRAGPDLIPEAGLAAALPPAARAERDALRAVLAAARTVPADPADPLTAALADAAKDRSHPFHPWAALRGKLPAAWRSETAFWGRELADRRAFNRANFAPLWDLSKPADLDAWFKHTPGSPAAPSPAGAFAVEPAGDRVVTGVYPAGVFSHLLSQKHGTLLTSPPLPLQRSVSVRMVGDRGGGVRVVVDGYPLGLNDTYPQRRPAGEPAAWHRLDTSYRAGADAYIEAATFDDLTRGARPKGAAPVDDGRSSVGVAQVWVSDNNLTPRDEVVAVAPLFADAAAPGTPAELVDRYATALKRVLVAWRDGTLTDAEAAFLDGFVRRGLLANTPAELPTVAPLLAEYRRLEAAVPVPRRAPGLLEVPGRDAPLYARGNHRRPGVAVPRGSLAALGGATVRPAGSGRLELADDLASPTNPLTARVMANRVWGWLLGRGIVATPDNFGALGERPTHPELLDWLAARFMADGWSVKRLVRRVVTSRTYRLGGTASPEALARDPGNAWLSHATVQRLDAEAIRDGLLAAAGELNESVGGPPVRGGPLDDGRRSVYLAVRRTAPHPFLDVFDKPSPLSCRGRRDVTTLPAQSLTMLNSAFTLELARRWGAKLAAADGTPDARVRRAFVAALGREPTADEGRRAREYLDAAAADHATTLADPRPWADFAHSLMCLKETIYLR